LPVGWMPEKMRPFPADLCIFESVIWSIHHA
jgi:hypothetical protein